MRGVRSAKEFAQALSSTADQHGKVTVSRRSNTREEQTVINMLDKMWRNATYQVLRWTIGKYISIELSNFRKKSLERRHQNFCSILVRAGGARGIASKLQQ